MTAQEFWTWFSDNNSPYLFLADMEEDERNRVLIELRDQLHQYCDGLFYEIGGESDDYVEFVITAAGQKEVFPMVEELHAAAPEIKGWKIIPFKQPQEPTFTCDYRGYSFDPTKMWFLPLEAEGSPQLIGIEVGVDDFEEMGEQVAIGGVYITLDTMLGERSCALDLDHLQVGALPEDVSLQGYAPLADLPRYIAWMKEKWGRD